MDVVGGVRDDGAVTLDDVAADLYSGLPGGFVTRRDEAARAAQSAGDRILAGLIGKLRKPTVGAWLGNLLAHRHPGDVAELVALGVDLRAAQDQLDAAAMRDLGKQRQQLVRSLVSRARATATELGEPPAGPALQELEATLVAAVADPDAAAQLTAGRLTTGLSYAGFGAFGAGAVGATPAAASAGRQPAAAKKMADGKAPSGKPAARKTEARKTEARKTEARKTEEHSAEVDAAERDLAQARLQAAQAEEDVEAATDAEKSAKAALTELEARAAELRKELKAVEDSITSNSKKLAWAATERKNAKATVAELARLVATAERALARITRS
jgi:hypothetical protein